MKKCKVCNVEKPKDEFHKISGKRYKPDWDCRDSYCKPCRREYQNERVRSVKKQAIEYLGGKCVDCGYVGHPCVFDFHHLDPQSKDFSFGSTYRKFDRIVEELDKCVLLCSNCHRLRHYSKV